MGVIYGYARVSAPGQDPLAQVAELEIAGCSKIFVEQASAAAGRKRPQLAKAVAALHPGDVLAVTRLNRLARSARDALNTLAAVTAKGAGFRALREAWCDTTTPQGRLVVTLMSGLAEFDREMILERTAEGRAHAKARGVKLGRPATLSRDQVEFVLKARAQIPPVPLSQLMKLLNASRSTIWRAAKAGEADFGFGALTGPPAGGDPRQVDLEELTGVRPPPSPKRGNRRR